MPDIIAGATLVTVDAEDFDFVSATNWYIILGPKRDRAMAVYDKMAKRRRFRLFLHREIAFRLNPKLVRLGERVLVTPKNGSYLDVRRDNLEITVKQAKRASRPRGKKCGEYTGTGSGKYRGENPPAWSAAGHRKPVVQRHGPGGDRLPEDPGERGQDRRDGSPGGGPGHQDAGVREGPGLVAEAL